MSSITLYIPQLLHPDNRKAVLSNTYVAKLLGKAKKVRLEDRSFEEQIGHMLAWPEDRLPVAELLAQYYGASLPSRHTCCATPVFLQADFSGIFLSHYHRDIPAEQSDAILATLNDFLQGSGMSLQSQSSRWFLSSESAFEIEDCSLSASMGKNITDLGYASNMSQRLLTEMQMLLHQHPVNVKRREAGELAINSVWIWGQGVLPEPFRAPINLLSSHNDIALAMASYLGIQTVAPTTLIDIAQTIKKDTDALVVLDDFLYGEHQNDATYIEKINRDWLLPISDAVKKVDVINIYLGDEYKFTLTKRDLWCFWRKSLAGEVACK